tara:strand:+ start:5373 stop:5681 length:309 start_codon:yes stop_codon:yes gene_type:complete
MLVELNNHLNGVQKIYKFENGYGASVVCHDGSYGGPYDEFEDNLWEIAVLDSEGAITYHTPVTQDVIGRANDDEVTRVLKEISELGSEFEKQLELKFGENND